MSVGGKEFIGQEAWL